jgi:hypothetical protein
MTDIINWKELTGNKYLTKFHPSMLYPKGYALKRSQAISRRNRQMKEVYVIFDRDYVLEILKSHFDLLAVDIDVARDLATEAMLLLDKERSSEEIAEHEAMYRDER